MKTSSVGAGGDISESVTDAETPTRRSTAPADYRDLANEAIPGFPDRCSRREQGLADSCPLPPTDLVEAIEDWELNYHRACVIEYVAAAASGAGGLARLRRARWHLEREIQRLTR